MPLTACVYLCSHVVINDRLDDEQLVFLFLSLSLSLAADRGCGADESRSLLFYFFHPLFRSDESPAAASLGPLATDGSLFSSFPGESRMLALVFWGNKSRAAHHHE